MRLSGVKAGDIVEVDKKGRRFHAAVTATGVKLARAAGIEFMPLDSRVTYRSAVAREVVGHWRKAAGRG